MRKKETTIKSTYPLKSRSLIYTTEDVALARYKIRNNKEARELAQSIVQSAEKWVEWDDEALMALIPDASVPRSFDLNTQGCPVHGDTIFKVGGPYPWILDPENQFKVECPVGREVYPSNDFEKSYKASGMPIREEGTVPYFDDGWGWEAEDGERYWFVAYSNHWVIRKYVQPVILNLGRAYLLTGRDEFAHKALVLLYRLAEVYPSMDYENQSRYGLMQKKNGGRYPGKVFNRIWETSFIQSAAECYDAVWKHIAKDATLRQQMSMDEQEIQAFIEVNLLEEAVVAYDERKIQGNFGMHQIALLYVLMARQHMNNDELIDRIINNVSQEYLQTGIGYALYNFVFRDGVPMESPSYNFLWIRTLTALSERLKDFGVNFFEEHRFQSVLKSPLRLMATPQFTVDVGDSGSTLGGVIGRHKDTYEVAFANTGDTSFLSWINPVPNNRRKKLEEPDATFSSLFRPEYGLSESENEPIQDSTSRLLAGYGLGILKGNHANQLSIALTYGMHGSHYHWDFLNFELFAFGQKMMPDFGYPDAMNAYVPGIYTWSKNTVAHNTLVVDAQKQNRNQPGRLHDFSEGDFAHIISASSPAYSQANTYRRHMVSVETDKGQNYTVDFFYVEGGHRHDYILHGPPGFTTVTDNDWGPPLPGTYAGRDVATGEIYDNPKMNQTGYSGGYGGYKGSGFQHLFNVRKKSGGEGIVDFQHLKDRNARLRIRVLQGDKQEIFMADAYNHPRSREFLIRHLICHSGNPSEPLTNTFVSVLEPYYGERYISDADRIEVVGGGWSQAVQVDREYEMDIVISDIENAEKHINEYSLSTDATSGVVTLNKEGILKRVFFSDGTYLSYGDRTFTASGLLGEVKGVDYQNRQFTVNIDDESKRLDQEHLNKSIVFFRTGEEQIVHPIKDAHFSGDDLSVSTEDDMLLGRINVSKINGETNQIRTNNVLILEETYIGAYILNEEYQVVGKVEKIDGNGILFSGDINKIFGDKDTTDIWISTIGVGDRVEMKTVFEWSMDD